MESVFIIKVQPKEFSQGLSFAFKSKPTKEKVIDAIDEILTKTTNENVVALCLRCIDGVKFYGIPSLASPVHEWKDKSMTNFSSKGFTMLQNLKVLS